MAEQGGEPAAATVVLGEIVGVHGVRGAVKVYSATRPRENIFAYAPWLIEIDGQFAVHDLISGQAQGKGLVARLDGIDDRDAAMALRGGRIHVERSALPALAGDEYYWADLEGLQVLTQQGIELGRVAGLMETGANDVLVVQGDRERLIPYVPGQFVITVDLAAGQLVVNWDPEF